ncbi:MAG: AAA family ATPase [Nanoarchaeota archaeon]|nr:AAA family ATPase [Nanoarchaeota archaeon]
MKFYNRKQELELLKKIIKGKNTRVIIVKGFRRIGKTRLIIESLKDKDYLRIFVPKDKTLSSFLADINERYGIPRFTTFRDFVSYIFEKHEIIFFDEFQNFQYMDKSIFSEFQDIIDTYKREDKKLCLFITGSSYSLLKKIFYDYAKALYGRKDLEIPLFEFDVKTVMEILSDLGIKNIEDKIRFWSIFGGIPKYYEMLESLKINNFTEFINLFYIKNFKSLLEEGNSILISELGGEYKIYYTVMEALSNSKNKISEIADFFDGDTNATNRYVDLLVKEYDLVFKNLPPIGKKKITKYRNKSNFFDFWFRFVRKYYDLYDVGEFKKVIQNFERDFNNYLGIKFEDFIIRSFNNLPFKRFNFTKIGKQWGKIPKAPKGKNTYEIDICAINEKTKQILFAECKWKNKVNPEKLIKELKEKTKYVDWNNDKRKEYYAIFAKSFSKKIKEKNIFLFDLHDLKKSMK